MVANREENFRGGALLSFEWRKAISAYTNSPVKGCPTAPADLRTQAELACANTSGTVADWRKLQAVTEATRSQPHVTRAASALAS
jgi:hypothetical protein